MKRFLRLAIVATLILSLVMMTACGDVTKLEISKTSLTITEGNSETLTLTGVPEGQTATWSSSDEKVASVAGGVVTAKKAGTCDITAKVGEQSVKCSVTVNEKPITLSLDKTSASLERGLTLQLVLTGKPEGETAVWTSSDTNVATVSNGLVTAVNKGSATIKVKVKTAEATCTLTVTDSRVLTLSKTAVRLSYSQMTKEEIFESETITAKVGAADITDVVWTSDDEEIATVDGGVITAVSEGTTKIKASYDGLQSEVDVTISEYIILDSTDAFTAIDEAVDSEYPGMSKNYILDGDLDFAGVDVYSLGYRGGSELTAFNGVLNGNGYTLHNIAVKKKVDSTGLGLLYNSGIFSKIGSNGIIKNLSITGLELKVGTSCGAFGDTNLGLIENVFVNMKIDSSQAVATAAKVNGGMVFRNSGTINNSLVAVDHVGGVSIVGAIAHTNEGTINNSFAIARGIRGATVSGIGTLNNSKVLTAAEAITEGTYSLWDKEIWTVEDGKLPYLGRGGQLDYNPNKEPITLTVSAAAEFPMGETMNILTAVSPVWVEGRIVWASDTPGVVTVSGGVLTAVSNGTATVTATLGDTVKTCVVTIKYPTIALNKDFVKLGVCDVYSDSFTLAGVAGSFDENEPLAFTSSSTAIATVNSATGVITPVAAGEATITVVGKRDGKRAEGECKVAVANYIKIGTTKEFRALNNAGSDLTFPGLGSDKMYILTSNLDFFGVNDFYSMGVKDNAVRIRFEGILNGNGYAIMNLNLKRDPRTTSTNPDSGQYDAGLFHAIGENGIVKNISLINVNINASQMCGLLAGKNYGLIENVYASGTLKPTLNNTKNAALVGINYASGAIKNAVVDFTLYPAGAGVGTTPSLAIITNNFGTVKDVYAKCSDNIAAQELEFKNFTSNSDDADVSNCAVKTDYEMKTAALYANFDQAIWNIADTKIPCLKNTPDVNVTVAVAELNKISTTLFIGETETLTVKDHTEDIVWKTSDESVVTVANGVLTPVAIGDALITATVDGKVGKCYVVVKSYILISTADQFYSTFVDPATHAPKAEAFESDKAYKLTANLDFAGKTFHALGVNGTLGTTQGGLKGVSFAGILDGGGYALKNITLTNHPNSGATNMSFQGLFLGVTSTGIIRNLGVVNMTMENADFCAVFGDAMQGKIENCFVDVHIKSISSTSTRFAGIALNPNLAGASIVNCFIQISSTNGSYTSGIANDGKPGVDISGCRVKKVGTIHSLIRGGGGVRSDLKFVASAASGTDTILETAAASYSHFDATIWKIEDGKLPYLKNMGSFPTRTA